MSGLLHNIVLVEDSLQRTHHLSIADARERFHKPLDSPECIPMGDAAGRPQHRVQVAALLWRHWLSSIVFVFTPNLVLPRTGQDASCCSVARFDVNVRGGVWEVIFCV